MKDPFLETLHKIVIIKVDSQNNLIMIKIWEKSDQEWSLGAGFCSGLSGWDTPGHRWRHWLAPTSLTYLQVPPRWWHFQKIIPLLGTFSWTNTTVLLDFVQMRRGHCLQVFAKLKWTWKQQILRILVIGIALRLSGYGYSWCVFSGYPSCYPCDHKSCTEATFLYCE